MSTKESSKKEVWSKVNITASRMNALQDISPKCRMTIPQCVDEALEVWLRDIAPERVSLNNLRAKGR